MNLTRCTDCGGHIGVVSVRQVVPVRGRNLYAVYCAACWADGMWHKGSERPPRCQHCGLLIWRDVAIYVKTRKAWFCNKDCQKEERCAKKTIKTKMGLAPTSRRRRLAATTSGSGTETGLPDETGTAMRQPRPQLSRNSPGTSTTESFNEATTIFNEEAAERCLNIVGLSLYARTNPPTPIEANETERGRWICATYGRITGQRAYHRVLVAGREWKIAP